MIDAEIEYEYDANFMDITIVEFEFSPTESAITIQLLRLACETLESILMEHLS